jgi:hypothetical protein
MAIVCHISGFLSSTVGEEVPYLMERKSPGIVVVRQRFRATRAAVESSS